KGVVPAKAGIHNHREWLWREAGHFESSANVFLRLWVPDLRFACPGRQQRMTLNLHHLPR
ncbi:unnamed protein product, partial [Phaeothamnion confervicola]